MTSKASWNVKSKISTVSADRAHRFCRALFEETEGEPRWRMVNTIARRLGVPFDEAETMAQECARQSLVDHRMHSVTLREGGRLQAQRLVKRRD